MVEARHRLEKQWSALRFGEVKVETRGGQHLFEVRVFLGDLDSQSVQVELYANGVRDKAPVRQEMKLSSKIPEVPGGYVYCASTSAALRPADYTARLVPHREGVAIPLENTRILWQR